MAQWWDWDEPYVDRWASLPNWAKLVTFPLVGPLLFAYYVVKLGVGLCAVPFLMFWVSRPVQRPVGEITLHELRTRAEEISACFQEIAANNPECDDVIKPGLVFARHLASVLNLPQCPAELAAHHAARTLKHLRCYKGIAYFDLQELAEDVVRWSEFHKPA